MASMHYEEMLTFEVFYNSNVENTVVWKNLLPVSALCFLLRLHPLFAILA